MHWELSDEQSMYCDSLRDWLAARGDSENLRSWLSAGNHKEFDDALIEEGWAGVGLDEAVGGEGGGLLELALTARELGRSAAPSARWLARVLNAAASTGEPALTRAALTDSALTAIAVRADRIPIHSRRPRFSDGRVSGVVPGVLAGQEAVRFLVPVTTADGGSGLVLVDREAEGVVVQPRSLLDRTRCAADLTFDGAEGHLLEGDADTALVAVTNIAAVLVAADALGSAERMMAMSVEYAKQRKQFDRPIAAFQAVKHASAQMLVTVESSFSVALFAAASVRDRGPDAALHAAAAKAQVTGRCAELADVALTVHGAIGYTWEYDLQLFYKRAKLDRVLFGSPEAWNERIATMLPLVPAAS